MMRQRVVMEDPVAYKAKLGDLERGTEAYSALYRQQHKRTYIIYMHVRMLDQTKTYAETVGYAKLKAACEDALVRLPKERIPVPRPVPRYIALYQKDEAGRMVLVPETDDAANQSKAVLDDDPDDLIE
ncbi:hypothetical protein AWB67_06831 [Caballeronia terrestris]|uniref:Uncharacterized protein n=2 Tax=Caballeronia terrestris TaxID=1226301 RepID=A0A158KWB7_9BURK|nr:hypothetical protein AWB67_06831 [Caballeronia terrestris]